MSEATEGRRRARRRPSVGMALVYLFMIVLSLVIVVPMLNLVAKSFCAPQAVSRMSGFQIWPEEFSLVHYLCVLGTPAIWNALKNSLIITVGGTALSVLLTFSPTKFADVEPAASML